MEFIKDKSGVIVLTFDNESLCYRTIEVCEDSKFEEVISLDQLRLVGNGGLKLMTILDLQEELEIITDKDFVVNEIKKNRSVLSDLIHDYEDSIATLNERIILFELEASDQASALKDILWTTKIDELEVNN